MSTLPDPTGFLATGAAGLGGTVGFVSDGLVAGGPGSSVGGSGVVGAADGSGHSGGGWGGSFDYCLNDADGQTDRDGIGGSIGGALNGMDPQHLNCHRNPGGPGNNPLKRAGGSCPIDAGPGR